MTKVAESQTFQVQPVRTSIRSTQWLCQANYQSLLVMVQPQPSVSRQVLDFMPIDQFWEILLQKMRLAWLGLAWSSLRLAELHQLNSLEWTLRTSMWDPSKLAKSLYV